tara:strand:- start:18 stop:233 length:216 start_codon:yes stop_codon:yes gene_type:complete
MFDSGKIPGNTGEFIQQLDKHIPHPVIDTKTNLADPEQQQRIAGEVAVREFVDRIKAIWGRQTSGPTGDQS